MSPIDRTHSDGDQQRLAQLRSTRVRHVGERTTDRPVRRSRHGLQNLPFDSPAPWSFWVTFRGVVPLRD